MIDEKKLEDLLKKPSGYTCEGHIVGVCQEALDEWAKTTFAALKVVRAAQDHICQAGEGYPDTDDSLQEALAPFETQPEPLSPTEEK